MVCKSFGKGKTKAHSSNKLSLENLKAVLIYSYVHKLMRKQKGRSLLFETDN